jgi:hypothetical protein
MRAVAVVKRRNAEPACAPTRLRWFSHPSGSLQSFKVSEAYVDWAQRPRWIGRWPMRLPSCCRWNDRRVNNLAPAADCKECGRPTLPCDRSGHFQNHVGIGNPDHSIVNGDLNILKVRLDQGQIGVLCTHIAASIQRYNKAGQPALSSKVNTINGNKPSGKV